MIVTSIKTHKITQQDTDLLSLLNKYISTIKNGSVIAVTSKIVAICEGRIVSLTEDKNNLIIKEAEQYLPRSMSKYDFTLTIKQGLLIPSAGIDESNSFEHYILWPEDSQKWANTIREHFAKRFKLTQLGVIITDSKTTPLRWGTTGAAIAHSGFKALNDYIGSKDVFDRELKVTKANLMDALAAAAVAVMGEGKEQTPIALIEDVPFVQFQNRNPSRKELDALKIEIENDLYAPLLTSVKWLKGGK
jgi:dihydrofolate synthase / folylpolyglutamate synthase